MPPVNILMKPASGICNLNCRYCFYHSLQKEEKSYSNEMMSFETLENVVKKAFEFAEDYVSFGFQGGEPTLRGLEFFKIFTELERRYNKKQIKVNRYIQTNGLVIDEKWAEFFQINNFLVGLSLDGPLKMHNTYRKNSIGMGSFNDAMNCAELFNKKKVEYNILYVVTSNTAGEGAKLYNWFKNNGFTYLQFIPCLDPMSAKRGNFQYSLSPKMYGKFLNDTFDCWYEDFMQGKYISIRYIDNIVRITAGQRGESCDMKGHCSIQNVIEADGSVYPCDFYVMEKWKLGNINEVNFNDIFSSEKTKKFISESFEQSALCANCRWLNICRNGCKRYRENRHNYYCDSYKEFLNKNISRISEVIKRLS